MRVFAYMVIGLLLGYAFLGKGFAYLHVPLGFPLFVGEIVLGAGILTYLFTFRTSRRSFRHPAVALLLVFMLLGVVRTLPYLSGYGLDAVRDAAVYYYGAFLIILAGICLQRRHLEQLQSGVALVGPIFLMWAPLALLVTYYNSDIFPLVPWTEIPVVLVKRGDLSIHITAVFILALVLPGRTWIQRHPLLVSGLCIAALAITFGNRAALLASLLGLTAAFALRPNWRFVKAGSLFALFLLVAFVADISISGGNSKRDINVRHIVQGVLSIFDDDPGSSYYYYTFQDTKNWRLEWWEVILEESFSESYLLTGRGFGDNLALAHGIIEYDPFDSYQLRSPHNVHMTVLARMGWPGLILWILVQASLVLALVQARKRARACGDDLVEGALAFVLCYWLMSMINASFDVYLEGPQGAIWFWSVMGFGLALTRLPVESGARETDPEPEEPATSDPGIPGRAHRFGWSPSPGRVPARPTFSRPIRPDGSPAAAPAPGSRE